MRPIRSREAGQGTGADLNSSSSSGSSDGASSWAHVICTLMAGRPFDVLTMTPLAPPAAIESSESSGSSGLGGLGGSSSSALVPVAGAARAESCAHCGGKTGLRVRVDIGMPEGSGGGESKAGSGGASWFHPVCAITARVYVECFSPSAAFPLSSSSSSSSSLSLIPSVLPSALPWFSLFEPGREPKALYCLCRRPTAEDQMVRRIHTHTQTHTHTHAHTHTHTYFPAADVVAK